MLRVCSQVKFIGTEGSRTWQGKKASQKYGFDSVVCWWLALRENKKQEKKL